METRKLNKEYYLLARDVINNFVELSHIKTSDIKIAFLESDKKKKSRGNLVFGECEKVVDKNKWAIPYDFTITIFKPNISHFSEEQIRILLFHELLHIGISDKGKLSIVPHDLEDFKLIIDKFGTNWSSEKRFNNR